MSGIYISGMEMPKEGCHHILCIYADGTVSTGGKTYRAKPIPDHGRLIDADALATKDTKDFETLAPMMPPGSAFWMAMALADYHEAIQTAIETAPTIIPADEEE